jgi:small-conductance mechanosensitive channel
MLVSALIGGAGVKLLELFVAWRKDSGATTAAEKASITAMEEKIRLELRQDNEKLRARLDALEGKPKTDEDKEKTEETAALPSLPSADSTGKIKKIVEAEMSAMTNRVKEVMSANDELRKLNGSLSESVKLMAETIVSLKAELEVYEKDDDSDPPPQPPVLPPKKKK